MPGHDAGPGADAARVLAQGDLPNVMGAVLDAPMRADGAAQDLGAVAGLTGVVADLLARGPQAGAGVVDVGQARHPGDAADQRLPGRVQKAAAQRLAVERDRARCLWCVLCAQVAGMATERGFEIIAAKRQEQMA